MRRQPLLEARRGGSLGLRFHDARDVVRSLASQGIRGLLVLSKGIRLPILGERFIGLVMGVVWSSFMARMVRCIKVGREAEGLDFLPYPGELGKRIFENVSKEAWKQWLEHQKTLLNENRLILADKKARDYLKLQMEKYFFGSGADVAGGYTPPSQK